MLVEAVEAMAGEIGEDELEGEGWVAGSWVVISVMGFTQRSVSMSVAGLAAAPII